MPSFGVVLDACVLVPAALRDTLLRAAEYRLYQLFWSEDILEEVHRTLVANHLTDPARASRLINQLKAAFPGSPVTGYHALIPLMHNDPKDRHVLAATVKAGAQLIVTQNLPDFAKTDLEPFGVDVQSPDEFLLDLFALAPRVLAQIIVEQTADKRRPTASIEETLAALAMHVPEFVRHVRQLRGAILTQHPDEQDEPARALGFFASVEVAQIAAELRWPAEQVRSVGHESWVWQNNGPIGPRWEARLTGYRYTIVTFPTP